MNKTAKTFLPVLMAFLLGSCSLGGTGNSSVSSSANDTSQGGNSSSSSSDKSTSSSGDQNKYPSSAEGAITFLKDYLTNNKFGEYTIVNKAGDVKQNMTVKRSESQIIVINNSHSVKGDETFAYFGYKDDIFYTVIANNEEYATEEGLTSSSLRQKIGTDATGGASITLEDAKKEIAQSDILTQLAPTFSDMFLKDGSASPDHFDFSGELTASGYSVKLASSFYSSRSVYEASYVIANDLSISSFVTISSEYSETEWSGNAPISKDTCARRVTSSVSIAKKQLTDFAFDTSLYFISSISKATISDDNTVSVGEDLVLSIDEYLPATALDTDAFFIGTSSDSTIVGLDEAGKEFIAKAEGSCIINIINTMNDVVGEINLTVVAGETPAQGKIEALPNTVDIEVGGQGVCAVTISETEITTFTAVSDDETIAKVTSIRDGKLTISAVAIGSTTITATIEGTSISTKVLVNVVAATPEEPLSVYPEKVSLEVGKTGPVQVTIADGYAKSFSVKSDDTSIASIESQDETSFTLKGVAIGSTSVTVTLTDTEITKTIEVTITHTPTPEELYPSWAQGNWVSMDNEIKLTVEEGTGTLDVPTGLVDAYKVSLKWYYSETYGVVITDHLNSEDETKDIPVFIYANDAHTYLTVTNTDGAGLHSTIMVKEGTDTTSISSWALGKWYSISTKDDTEIEFDIGTGTLEVPSSFIGGYDATFSWHNSGTIFTVSDGKQDGDAGKDVTILVTAAANQSYLTVSINVEGYLTPTILTMTRNESLVYPEALKAGYFQAIDSGTGYRLGSTLNEDGTGTLTVYDTAASKKVDDIAFKWFYDATNNDGTMGITVTAFDNTVFSSVEIVMSLHYHGTSSFNLNFNFQKVGETEQRKITAVLETSLVPTDPSEPTEPNPTEPQPIAPLSGTYSGTMLEGGNDSGFTGKLELEGGNATLTLSTPNGTFLTATADCEEKDGLIVFSNIHTDSSTFFDTATIICKSFTADSKAEIMLSLGSTISPEATLVFMGTLSIAA